MFLILAVVLSWQFASASILSVPEEYSSIQLAMDDSEAGDTVLVARGTYTELLNGPDHSISLFSNHYATQDTMDVLETILDGDSLGTILTMHVSEAEQSHIAGFTFTGGLGLDAFSGGAIQLPANAHTSIRDCVFHHNNSFSNGSAIHSRESDTLAYLCLENLTLFSNDITSTLRLKVAIVVDLGGELRVQNVKILDPDSDYVSGVSLGARDSLFVNGLELSSADGANVYLYGGTYCEVKNLAVSNGLYQEISIEGGHVVVDSMLVDSAIFTGSRRISIVADSSLNANNIVVNDCQNHSQTGSNVRYGLLSIFCFNFADGYYDVVKNVMFSNNVIGDTLQISEQSSVTGALTFGNISLENWDVLNNVMHLWPDDSNPNNYVDVKGALAKGQYSTEANGAAEDTIRIRNCRFESNLLIDHDDYSTATQTQSANWGRSLYIDAPWAYINYLEMDHLIFRNNRQPNHCPELGGEEFAVGSEIWVNLQHPQTNWVSLHDIQMEDIDDGGIIFWSHAQLSEAYNITFKNISRMGMWVQFYGENESSIVSNIYAENVYEEDMFLPYPFNWGTQRVLSLGTENVSADNCTFVSCDMTVLGLTAGLRNSIITDTDFDYLISPTVQNPDSIFMYNYTDFELNGEGNIFGIDPYFDSELGAPFLTNDSPCIDLGSPATSHNDPENPESPGFALWPAHGELRNDIGFFGGPRSAVLDTNWVGVKKPDVHFTIPQEFALGQPYPNPFNPSTNIPYFVSKPSHVSISVYNIRGQKVQLLIDEFVAVGNYSESFSANQMASGVYFVKMTVQDDTQIRKMLLLK